MSVSKTVEVITIPAKAALDSITVVLQDFEPGKGRLIVECYGDAWSTYWGAMSGQTLRQFISESDSGYVTNRLWPAYVRRTKKREDYLYRIVKAVQAELAGPCAAGEPQQ